ncbi:MAG: TonB-dependent receptor [Gemmatimonadales bacterium]
MVEFVTVAAMDSMPPLGPPYADTTRVAGVELDTRWGLLSAGGRVDRFWGDAVRQGVFTAARAHLGASGRMGRRTEWGAWWISPAARIDGWTTGDAPAYSLRLDAGLSRGSLGATAGFGGSAAPPVIADLIFHEGVGVRPNPELRAERVPWELEGALTWQPAHWRVARPRIELGAYVGRIRDMVLWAPDFRFVWSPRNFDARRAGVALDAHVAAPRWGLVVEASYALSSVRYDRPEGPQVIYRPRNTQYLGVQRISRHWTGRLSVRRLGERFPNHGGVGALDPVTVTDASISVRPRVGRADLDLTISANDIFDVRAAFIAEYPSPGRSLTAAMTWEW